MSEPTIETLARRLDRVERENRHMKQAGVVALAVIAAVVLMGQATPSKVAKVIEAEKFVVRDKSGKVRAELSMSADGSPQLILRSSEGKSGAVLAVGTDGSPSLVLYDRNDKPRIGLSVSADGSPDLVMFSRAGKVTGKLIWSRPWSAP